MYLNLQYLNNINHKSRMCFIELRLYKDSEVYKMLFSIIVPVYNVEYYLEECLNSIINQIIELNNNCELILIDDGSTDSSGEICDRYKEMYPHIIKVIHNKNQGLLLTRRCGFRLAEGEYIVNCDSDDKLELNALKRLKEIINIYNSPDIIIFNYYMFNNNDKKIAFENVFADSEVCIVDKKEILTEFIMHHTVNSLCGKIFKKSCINVDHQYQQFAKIGNGEDSIQSIEVFNNANTFVYLNEGLYDYRSGSGMTQRFDNDYYFLFKTIIQQVEEQQCKWQLCNFDQMIACKVMAVAGLAITQSRYNNWDSYKEHKIYLQKIRKDEMFKKNISYLRNVKSELQLDHFILLILLKIKAYTLICILLKMKNILEKR